jgi:hypothetical protein
VFIAGVFFGIWMDWSARQAGGRDLIYQVQDYQMANLMVQGGDRLWLEPPPGGNGKGLAINFLGGPQYDPCLDAGPVNPCVIKTGLTPGAGYLFTCDSPQGYSCTDPGVQQSPTGPLRGPSYSASVKKDFTHLLGIRQNPRTNPEPSEGPGTGAGTQPAAGAAVRAYVGCSAQNQTTLQDPNGGDLTTINASQGQSVFWISPIPFSLDLSSAPGLCAKGNPSGGGPQSAQCTIALPPQTVQYKVQAQSCNSLAATLVITKP